MITKIDKVNNADYCLSGQAFIPSVEIMPKTGVFPSNNIPFLFNYNCNWKIMHKCKKCVTEVSFGEELESYSIRRKNFSVSEYLCSKYYDDDFLTIFPNLFSYVEIKEAKKKTLSNRPKFF